MRSTNNSSEYICIVVGQSGVGKSNFINSITCSDKCSTSSWITSCTRMYNCVSTIYDNFLYNFIDTPGFNDCQGEMYNFNKRYWNFENSNEIVSIEKFFWSFYYN